jgi:hypothetical protein
MLFSSFLFDVYYASSSSSCTRHVFKRGSGLRLRFFGLLFG